MPGAVTSPLAGFHFTTIGQPPSLLTRISSAEDCDPHRAPSPTPSPLSSPRMSATPVPSTSRLLAALAPQEATAQSLELLQANAGAATVGSDSRVKDAPPHLFSPHQGQNNSIEPRGTRELPSQAPSNLLSQPSLSNTFINTAVRPSLLSTKANSAPSGSSSLTGVSPIPLSTALPQGEDAIESFRQALKRLQVEADTYGDREEETRRATARQQDQAARWHARADAALENMHSLFAAAEKRILEAEQRAAQLAHFETEVGERVAELRETHAALTQAKVENAELRRTAEEERTTAAERRQTDDRRTSEVLAKAQAAVKQAESRERERQIAESLLRKKGEDDRARWDARERELTAQLEELRRQFAIDKQALQAELEEYKRIAEEEKQRRVEELVEEKRRLEERLALAQGRPCMELRNPSSSPSPTCPTLPSTAAASDATQPGTEQNAAHAKSRDNELHLSAEPITSQSVNDQAASRTGARTNLLWNSVAGSPSQQPEPLLAVKEEDTDDVKTEVYSHIKVSSLAPSPDTKLVRREQSLDYATPQPQPIDATGARASHMSSSAIMSSIGISDVAAARAVGRLESPTISLGEPSPEPPLVTNRWQDATLGSRDNFTDPAAVQLGSALPPPVSHQPTGVLHAPAHLERVDSQGSGSHSRPTTPPLDSGRRAKLIHRRVLDSPPPPAWQTAPGSRPSNRSSRSPPPIGYDHWSPASDPNRPPRQDRYTPPIRHKRTRDDDRSPDLPDARRPRLAPPANNYRPALPPLDQRISDHPATSPERRGRTPDRYLRRSPSPHAPRGRDDSRYDDANRSQRQAPPPDNRARTPPYPKDYAMNGYAVAEVRTALNDTEAHPPQIDAGAPIFATLPQSGAYAPSASVPTPRIPAVTKKAAAATANAARKPAHKQLSPQYGNAGKKSLIERMAGSQGAALGSGDGASIEGNAGADGHVGGKAGNRYPPAPKHPSARAAANKRANGHGNGNSNSNGIGNGGRGHQARGQNGAVKTKPLVDRLQPGPPSTQGPSLADRLS
ncbi:hypothetical protein C8Q74DRAFT_1367913 [Fomes fomentarius]|nr:hypothetical protein C8Q74DRAFT_1367913 [Fomes fomentarius]